MNDLNHVSYTMFVFLGKLTFEGVKEATTAPTASTIADDSDSGC